MYYREMNYYATIVIPTYNREQFSKLILHNIKIQTYPLIKEILIGDDGETPLDVNDFSMYPIKYFKMPRCSIGEKRNFLVSQVQTKYCVFMDTDDFYNPNYISKSIFNMLENGKLVSGSSDMLIYGKQNLYRQRCLYIHLLNEATLVFDMSVFHNNKFNDANSSEGVSFLTNQIENIIETDINDIMICVAHNNNTVKKDGWLDDKYYTDFKYMNEYREHLKILSNIKV